jgi:hypothetical protein
MLLTIVISASALRTSFSPDFQQTYTSHASRLHEALLVNYVKQAPPTSNRSKWVTYSAAGTDVSVQIRCSCERRTSIFVSGLLLICARSSRVAIMQSSRWSPCLHSTVRWSSACGCVSPGTTCGYSGTQQTTAASPVSSSTPTRSLPPRTPKSVRALQGSPTNGHALRGAFGASVCVERGTSCGRTSCVAGLPDLTAYNAVNGGFTSLEAAMARVSSDGAVYWSR